MVTPRDEAIKEAVRRLFDLLGEAFVILNEKLQHQWARLFGARNILILGPTQSGKTSLVLYLKNGKPFYVEQDGGQHSPNPTSSIAIIGAKSSVGRGQWVKVASDVPGDVALRETWKQVIDQVAPHGIIFMLDGQRTEMDLIEEIKTTLNSDVLSNFKSGARQLATLHVFLNFSDRWAPDAAGARGKEAAVFRAFDELVRDYEKLKYLRFAVSTTHLAPDHNSWAEMKRALQRFAIDLSG